MKWPASAQSAGAFQSVNDITKDHARLQCGEHVSFCLQCAHATSVALTFILQL